MIEIPISRPIIGEREIEAVVAVLRSGHLASGPRVKEFEEAFAAYVEAEHAVAVSNGTSGLIVGLKAAGIGPGDEVIVPSFTFAATANAVRVVGATPAFADIDEETYCVTAGTLEAALTPRTKAVMPVHLYGYPSPMGEILDLASAHGLLVFEDAAQAHGASWQNRPVGAIGTFGMFSFYPTKNMTTGEGGMITTNDPDIADRARVLRNQGMKAQYHHDVIGTNERMTEVAAALGLGQLANLHDWTERRRANAKLYQTLLTPGVKRPTEPERGTHVFHQYTIRVPDRERVVAALESAGIGYGIYYPIPTHRQGAYQSDVHLPVTDLVASQVISLPVRPDLDEGDVERIASVVNAAVGA